jgi:hypothetical protein
MARPGQGISQGSAAGTPPASFILVRAGARKSDECATKNRRPPAAEFSTARLNDLIPLMVELLWALMVVVVVLSIAAVIVGCAS